MNIGFDLDNIFISTPPFVPKHIIDKLYKKRDNGILLYRIPSLPEQMLRHTSHVPFLRPAIKDNLEFLRSLSKEDNKLYLISSRFKFLEKRTAKLVKKYGLDKIFDEMYFNFENNQPHVFKNDVLKKLNLDIYVDDDLSLIKHVANENNNTKFFWLRSYRSWLKTANKKEELPNNIFAISKLAEMFS